MKPDNGSNRQTRVSNHFHPQNGPYHQHPKSCKILEGRHGGLTSLKLMMTEINSLVPLKVHGVLVDPNTDTQIVILRDEKNSEVLPIWVGTAEGTSIRLALESVVPPVP